MTCGGVKVGDRVKVSGTVKEFAKGTQLDTVTAQTVVASNQPLPKAVTVTLPYSGGWEKYEGMRLSFPQTLTVTDNFGYGRYGQLGLSVGGRLFNPTNGNDTSTQAGNDERKIVIDDGVSAQNPAALPYLGAQTTRRTGDTLSGVSGVWVQNAGGYMLEPVAAPVFTAANPRPDAPAAVGGTLRVAGANVLNYFTDLNPDYSSSGPRGANSAGEFERQQAKIVASLKGLDADIVTLMEVQNNGDTALTALVAALNKEVGAGTYDLVKTGSVGSDAIHVAIIYKPARVTPVGAVQIDTDPVYSRPPVAQTFKDTQGGVLTVIANHFKSKGSCDNTDPDLGQGCWNKLRVQQAGGAADLRGQAQDHQRRSRRAGDGRPERLRERGPDSDARQGQLREPQQAHSRCGALQLPVQRAVRLPRPRARQHQPEQPGHRHHRVAHQQ